MKILYVHQYFITPAQHGGTRSYEFAKHLMSRGHEVTMITSGLQNTEFPVKAGDKVTEHDCDGIRVLSIAAGYNDARRGTGMGGFARMRNFLRFANLATKVGKTVAKPDIILCSHTPLTVGLTGIRLKKHFGVPFVFEVRDLWPDALINIGALRNPLAIWFLRRMERRAYDGADHIVALSPGMKLGVCRQGVAEEKVSVIPNSSDLELFHPDIDGSEHRERLGLRGKFTAIYFGAMGLANGLDYALEAANILKRRERDDIVLVLHGEGGMKSDLKARAAHANLTNVIFSDSLPSKQEVSRVVASCDVCMTIYKATKEVTWSPNKMFDALAAGKPVLINVGQWLGETIEENGCGISCSPEDPTDLADALEKLSADPHLRARMGRNSRALAENEFDRKKLAARLENVLAETLS
ncbi:glycosyltransferase family 4 protein [Altererythrobacter litoralis]|uniref:Glycosyltransferase family 4 protein n=1 Tax=Altererythrobacter litoralis TaxID=3113904 RepID=A0ABU7GF03_9SPHN|nr:glycosyltransferase family 4 protein [Erythrobacteraceae bacterium 1XM1-14]